MLCDEHALRGLRDREMGVVGQLHSVSNGTCYCIGVLGAR